MAFLQRKRTLRLSTSTCHLFQTQPGLSNPPAQPHAPKARERPTGRASPSTSHQGVTTRPQEKRPRERGACPPRREPGEATPPCTEPHERLDGRAALPALFPAQAPPPAGCSRPREEGNPAGWLPPAPGAPAAIGPWASGNRAHPHAAMPRGAPAPRPVPYRGGPGGGTAAPARAPTSLRAGQEKGELSREQHRSRPGKALAPPTPGEAIAGRRAGRTPRAHGESPIAKPERTFKVLARGARAGTCAVPSSTVPSRPASEFCASCGRERGTRRESVPCSALSLPVSPSLRRGPPPPPLSQQNSRPLVSKCRSCEEPECRPWHRGALGLRSPRRKRGSACATELPLPSPLPLARAVQDGSSPRSNNSGRVDGVVFFPALSVTPFHVNLVVWEFTLMFSPFEAKET